VRTHVALLRAVNVGGKNKIAMSGLRRLFVDLGLSDPVTFIQSGNVVFTGDGTPDEELESKLESAIDTRLGVRCGVFVRTADELAEVIRDNPFPDEARGDPQRLAVVFCRRRVLAEAVLQVQQAIAGPERIGAAGRQIYVVYPEGMGASKVSRTRGWSDLVATGTARNWNTVVGIAQLMGAGEGKT
jgi:uncharacterized protein (DUF1697 family)